MILQTLIHSPQQRPKNITGLAHCPTFCRWGSLIPQVAFANIGSANPRSLQAEAKIRQFLADHLSEGIHFFLITSDKWYSFCYIGIL